MARTEEAIVDVDHPAWWIATRVNILILLSTIGIITAHHHVPRRR
jgi:hypothetical protein